MQTRHYAVLSVMSALLVISLLMNIHLISQNNSLKAGIEELAEDLPPEIVGIDFLDANDQDVMEEGWAKVPTDGQLRIRFRLRGRCTSIDLFITPTGTETHLLQTMVASIHVAMGQEEVEYVWDVPKGIMGHFSAIAYNGMKATKSDMYNIYAE